MAPGASSSNPAAYEKGEKVLCFHHELLYEAKILDDPQREDEKDKMSPWKYRVHYKGWKNTWDDWVPQDRLRKLTEDNRELAASLRRDVMQAESRQRNPRAAVPPKKGRTQGSEIGSGRGSEERTSSVPAGGRGTKRGKDNEIEKVAIPEFSTPRTRSRVQSTGFSPGNVSNSPDPAPSGSRQDQESEFDLPGRILDFARRTSVESRSNTGGPFKLQEAPRGRAAVPNRIKTVAMRTIHGHYDEDDNFTHNKDVISRRGYFNDDEFTSPELDAATNIKSRTASKPSRRSMRSELQTEQNEAPLAVPGPETAIDEGSFEHIMDILSRPPPPDEPEHMTQATFNKGLHWAPLIGGTSDSEKVEIQEAARAAGLWTPKRQQVHPQYEKTRIYDPLNANRLLFFEGQDPDRRLMIAGVPKDPDNIDPPGSGGPFDALKFPDRLVKLPVHVLGNLTVAHLQQLDRATILRFPKSALRMLPPRFLSRLKIPIPSEEDINHDDSLQEEAFYARPSVNFTVPDMIKGYLVDDWENVTKSLLLVALPSRAPVNWLLDTYFHEEKGKRRLGSPEADQFVEIVDGLKIYFGKMLGKTLLYKFERGQYAEMRKIWEAGENGWEGRGPGDCYGAEHFLRLIINLPEYIAQTSMEAQAVAKIKEEITLLNHWICRNYQRLFINQYERPSAEYIERARD